MVSLDRPAVSAVPRGLALDAALERLLVFVAATSLVGVALGLLGLFSAPLVLVLAALATWAYHRLMPGEVGGSPTRLVYLLPVLLVALAFRLMPYPQVYAGQDQGVYSNMAAELARTGDLAVVDAPYDRLASAGVLDTYRAENYTDPFLPGVYSSEDAKPELRFQFYHVFPVWLALAGAAFGLGGAGLGLTFLSLASIVFFQRLATALTGDARMGALAGLLLALNPLHAFFSKFPLTEIPTLAFSAMGFCFLVMYALQPVESRRARWLALSALAFLCLFLTRISGFMYLPVVLVISASTLLLDADRERARALAWWALATTLAYLASVAYGLAWSRPYALKIYQESFGLVAGENWPTVLLALSAFVAITWAAIWRWPRGTFGRVLAATVLRLEASLGVVVLLLIAFGAVKLYQLGFTGRHAGNASLLQFDGLVGQGWSSVARSSLLVAALYLGPLASIAFLWAAQRRWNPAASLLLFFLTCFIAYVALLNWTVPYQPYYARYLASELVPYALLFVVCATAWTHGRAGRRALSAVLLVTAVGYVALSAAQLGKRENAGALESITRLAAFADDGDLIALDSFHGQGFAPKALKMSLAHAMGRQVISIGSGSLSDARYLRALAGAYDEVFLMSAAPAAPPGFTRIDGVRLRVEGFLRSAGPPTQTAPVIDANINVYRLDRVEIVRGSRLRFEPGTDLQVLTQVGERSAKHGLRSRGAAGYLLYGPYERLPGGRYRVDLRGSVRARGEAPMRVDVTHAAGSQVLAATTAAPGPSADGLLGSLEFQVPDAGVADLEIRALVAPGSSVAIREYTITRVR